MSTMMINNPKNATEALSLIANNLGISYYSARSMYYDPRSYKGDVKLQVQKNMEAFGFAPKKRDRTCSRAQMVRERLNAIPEGTKANTMREIAEHLGISHQTVRNALCASSSLRMSDEMVSVIKEAVQKLDFVSHRSAEGKQRTIDRLNAVRRARFYYGGNFHSEAEEIARMRQLREEGYTNMQIATKVGRSYHCVLAKIGKQPADMTANSKVSSGIEKARKYQDRKLYVANHTIRVYNSTLDEIRKLREEADMLKSKADKLERDMAKLEPEVKKALKIATVPLQQVAADLANAEPTTLQ